MKNLFLTIKNNPLLGYVKRLAILCVFLSIFVATATAEHSTHYSKATVTAEPTGGGTVYVATNSTKPISSEESATQDCDKEKSKDTHVYYFWADPNEGYTFINFTDGSNTYSNSVAQNISVDASSESSSEPTTLNVVANFKKIIDPKETNIEWTKKSGEDTYGPIGVTLTNATNFNCSITCNGDANNTSFSCTPSSTTMATGDITLEFYAGGDVTNGMEFLVILTADGGGYAEINVKIISSINVTFIAPSVEGCSFVAKTTNQNNTTYDSKNFSSSSKTKIPLEDTKSFPHILTATAGSGYEFMRWVITDANGDPVDFDSSTPDIVEPITDNPYNYSLKDGVTISAEFVKEGDYAQFQVKGNAEKSYFILEEAIKAAQLSSGKTVVVSRSGELYTGHKTPTNEKYEFTIPTGITLLVPGDDKYTVNTQLNENDNEIGDFDNTATKCFSYLTLSSNTRIVAQGNICVFSKLSYKQRYNGLPSAYGEIKMGAGTEIVMENGSNLTCFGYISGDYNNSQVIAEPGATVYEAFQMRDWRGGKAASGMNNNDQLVFPVGQYYVQSIETKLILNSGAEEYVSSCVAMSVPILGTQKFPLNFPFVMKDNGSVDDKGFLCLGSGARVVKWYDYNTDRQMYRIEGESDNATAKFGNMVMDVSVKVESRKYVLAVSNNIDVTLNNISVTSLFDMALLADVRLHIEEDATLMVNGEIFVYDKEQQRKEYFYPGAQIIQSILYTAHHDKAPTVRKDAEIQDASIVVDGKLIVQAPASKPDSYHGTGLYTTAMDANGTSTNDADYGANITSNGGGIVDFQVEGTNTVTYQYNQTNEVYISIPVTNARLRNEDVTYEETEAKKYFYYKPNKETLGKWLVPTFGISSPANNSNKFAVTLPQPKQQNVVCNVTTAGVENVSIANFTGIELQEDSRFVYENGEATYEGDNESGKLTIPLTYTAQNIHNLGNPYTEEMTITYKYVDPIEGVEKTGSAPITLEATEDYTPNFVVKVGDKDVMTEKQYKFEDTYVFDSNLASVTITPEDGNVAKLPTIEWQVEASESPTFTTEGEVPSSLNLLYKPQTKGEHEGQLIIKAIYIDKQGNEISNLNDIIISLKGTGRLNDNELAFKQDLIDGYTIYQGLTYQNIFANTGNNSPVTFNFTYVGGDLDGQDASELLSYVPGPIENNYTIKANEVASITEPRQVKVVASQDQTTAIGSATCDIILTVVPPIRWNWSDLYFGVTYTDPITTTQSGWTLTEIEDVNNMVGELQGDNSNYSVTVENGNLNEVYEVKFKFVQGQNEKEFTSKIYADPRILGFCVDASHKYKGVTQLAKGGVSFDDAKDVVSLNAGAEWVIQMLGIPDRLNFTASGDNNWMIEQSANLSTWTPVVTWASLGTEAQSFSLLPTTRFVRVTYGSSNQENVGQLSNICITKMSVMANVKEVYLPIYKDGSISSKSIVLTHTEKATPTLSPINGLTYETSTSDNLGTEEDPYYETTLTIKTPSSFAKGTYEFTATQGSDNATIRLHTDYLPQGLPIDFASDDEKRYHFVATEPSFVSWDATKKQVVLQNPGGSVARSVVLAFEGAPSRISFTADRDIVDTEWKIFESVDGTDGSFEESSIEKNRDKESGANFVHNLKYTTRYVRIYYYSENQTELRLSNLLIDGDPMLLVNPDELEFSNEDETKTLTLTAINLRNIKVELNNTTDFKMSHGSAEPKSYYELTPADYQEALGENKVGEIEINTEWITNSMVNDGIITIYNMDDNNSVLAKVKLVGAGKYLKLENAEKTGLYTGIPDGTRDVDGDGEVDDQYKYTYHGSQYSNYTYHEVNLKNAFSADGTALFDYLFVYGETTPSEGDNITAPAGDKGSNARTPCYVYIRDMDVNGNFDRYRFVTMLDNVNVGDKAKVSDIITGLDIIKSSSETSENGNGETLAAVDVKYIEVSSELSVYITGFAPYATTGYTKADEGVFFFRGNSGAKLHVYLENAHIFARNKMKDGQPFYTRGDERNPTFSEKYARGSGGVLVFECVDQSENLLTMAPFEVTIHTIGRNLLKSNYGCFNYFFGMDPFQISAPIHVRLHSEDHVRTSKTVVNFTDEWPTKLDANRAIKESERTNGFLSLQKQSNNAPSIDLGNPHTVVNFLGGQVELQNAQIVSTNYKTTLAISYRSGEYGSDNLGLRFAYGIGTDAAEGTVNFHDGTITILPMWVKEEYKNYYMIDKDADGNEIKRDTGKKDAENKPIYEYQTTCLRTPKNTNVYGGSICWLRACQHVTSKGGAPSDGTSRLLGQYVYEFGGDDTKDSETGLVTSIKFPACVENLKTYYDNYGTYGIESVMPDKDNKLYFWIPEGYGGVTPEKDNILTTWKTCMTEISAGFQGQKGSVGGNTSIESNEEVKYLLYCKIDDNIHDVISKGEGQGDDKIYEYKAPVKVPDVALGFFEGKQYTTISPTFVGGSKEHEVLSDIPYKVTDKVYYVTTATADVWQTFTAPFNVARIWVVETFDENKLVKDDEQRTRTRSEILMEQAKHNADFAAFFAVAMAIGTTDSFEKIYESYLNWAKIEDEEKDNINYTKRGKYPLTPYVVDILEDGKTSGNWEDANFYINHNEGNWGLTNNIEQFEVQWNTLTSGDLEDGILMHQGQTYSLLFPYCVGCWDYEGESILERTTWDYWSGKFLIFESADAPQTINGSDFLIGDDDPTTIDVFNSEPSEGEVVVTGNSTLSFLNTNKKDIYSYVPNADNELFSPNTYGDDLTILPTTAFLYGEVPTNVEGASVLSISRMGQIKYRPSSGNNNDDTQTGGEHVPTINGGSDLFVTSVAEGINIAVSEPQYVGVFSATGQLIYSGWVETSVDVNLVVDGVYVVVGENTSLKVLY